MTTTRHHADEREFYTPGTSITADGPGRIERFVRKLYSVHRLRGGVTFRAE